MFHQRDFWIVPNESPEDGLRCTGRYNPTRRNVCEHYYYCYYRREISEIYFLDVLYFIFQIIFQVVIFSFLYYIEITVLLFNNTMTDTLCAYTHFYLGLYDATSRSFVRHGGEKKARLT